METNPDESDEDEKENNESDMSRFDAHTLANLNPEGEGGIE